MAIQAGLYWQTGTAALLATVKEQVEAVFPAVKCTPLAPLEPPAAGWDTFRGQYDVHCLLDVCQLPAGYDLVLWLVQVDIGDPWHSYLFGAASQRKAVVSAARLVSQEDIGKEAGHEIGHLLGLSHCRNECLMRPSRTSRGVQGKMGRLCSPCQGVLAARGGGDLQNK
ncbi:MAG: hypothetical protein PWQ18_1530 [Clostridia bacterium]|nr:hypothetical protein [Clostridia bacterium]